MSLSQLTYDEEEEYHPWDEYAQQTCGTSSRVVCTRPEDDEPPAPELKENKESYL